jgi:hypothetical protein
MMGVCCFGFQLSNRDCFDCPEKGKFVEKASVNLLMMLLTFNHGSIRS